MQKTNPGRTRSLTRYRHVWNGQVLDSDTIAYNTGSSSIVYDDGRRLPNGHWPWKECVHDVHMQYSSPIFGYAEVRTGWPASASYDWEVEDYTLSALYLPSSIPAVPDAAWDQGVLNSIMSQVDLNTSDAVLLYAGVVQALPFLGGVLRLNSILRSVSSHITKSMRRKPFTTVIKDLIQADFIDRFVISPTLDDARKFQDAVDYTLRVIQTARERSAHRFALSAESSKILSDTTGTTSYGQGSVCTFYGDIRTQTRTTSKAFMLLEAEYNMDAIDPLKVYAQRIGLTRPLESVWDLVPFSFVADYFFKGGEFISALSDEMSSVEGLKGTVTKIHDLWGTLYNVSQSTCVGTRMTELHFRPNSRVYKAQQYLSEASVRSSHFERFRIRNPWATLLSAQKAADYLSVNLSLSQTRKRTLAELVIQAKL